MRTLKRTLANFSFFDQQTIEKKLEDMAAKGWMVTKAGNFFWTYERIPPQKLRFAVTYFPGASEFDPQPSEKQLEKEELIARDGWKLVLRWDAMQIFCTDREDAVPIETDPVPGWRTSTGPCGKISSLASWSPLFWCFGRCICNSLNCGVTRWSIFPTPHALPLFPAGCCFC